MPSIIRTAATRLVFAAAALSISHAACSAPPGDAEQGAAAVKTEFLHAWSNYEKYAWGHDALKPLSHQPHDWYGQSLMMTPVDALLRATWR